MMRVMAPKDNFDSDISIHMMMVTASSKCIDFFTIFLWEWGEGLQMINDWQQGQILF